MLTTKIINDIVTKELYNSLHINDNTTTIAYNALKTVEYTASSTDIQNAVTFKSGAEIITGGLGIQTDLMVLGDSNFKGTVRINNLIATNIEGLHYDKFEDDVVLVNGYDTGVNTTYYKKQSGNIIDITTTNITIHSVIKDKYYGIAIDVSEYVKTGTDIHTILSAPNNSCIYDIIEKDITGVTTIATYTNYGFSKFMVGRTYTNTLITEVYNPVYEVPYTGTRTITVNENNVDIVTVVDTISNGTSTGVVITIESVEQTGVSYTYVNNVLTIISTEHPTPGITYTTGSTYVDDLNKIWLYFLDENLNDIKINADELTTETNTLTLLIKNAHTICVNELII